MILSDLKWWSGLLISAVIAGAGLYFFPHEYHDYIWGVVTLAGVLCAHQITPAGSSKDTP